MLLRIIMIILAGAAILILQIGFLSVLPPFLSGINLLLIASIFILAIHGLAFCLYWSMPFALILDLLTFSPFGLNALSLAIALALAHFLQHSYLTNRSLYSFLTVTLSAGVAYRLVFLFGRVAIILLQGLDIGFIAQIDFWVKQAKAIPAELIVVAVIFFLLNLFNKQFQPVFISSVK